MPFDKTSKGSPVLSREGQDATPAKIPVHPASKLLRKMLSASSWIIPTARTSTSISDNQRYPQFCLRAALNGRAFNQFRRNSAYNEILEHVTREQGDEYLREIGKHSHIAAMMDVFKANDLFGNPRVFDYEGIGAISPSTLRYVKVLADLEQLFGSLDHFRICEIGVGYGGQCRIINSYFRPTAYRLVDLRPVLMLAERFLDNFALPATISYSTMNGLEPIEYDLMLSNYALTELPRQFQEVYIEKVVLRSKRGYITYNEISPPSFDSYTKKELTRIIPGAKVMDEVPLTHPRNSLIVWGASESPSSP